MARFYEFNQGKIVIDLDHVIVAIPKGNHETVLRLDIDTDAVFVVDRKFDDIKKILSVKIEG